MLTLGLLLSDPALADPECERMTAQVESRATSVWSDDVFALDQILGESTPQVLFMGEAHDDPTARLRTEALLGEFDCYFVELPENLGEILANSPVKSRYETVARLTVTFCENMRALKPGVSRVVCPTAATIEESFAEYFVLAKRAHTLGVKIKGFDLNRLTGSEAGAMKQDLLVRNAHMANVIEQAIVQKECKHIIVNTGLAHVVVDDVAGELKSVPTLLAERGIQSRKLVVGTAETMKAHGSGSYCEWDRSLKGHGDFLIENWSSVEGSMDWFDLILREANQIEARPVAGLSYWMTEGY